MKKIIIAIVIIMTLSSDKLLAPPANNIVKLAITLVTGAAAADSAANATEAKAIYQQKDAIVEKLKSQGIDPTDGAIYSAYFHLDKNAYAIYWERWIGWPNIFVEVEVEGQGSFVLPRIEMSYQGQQMLENLIAKNVAPGTLILIHVLDDYHLRNEIWNSVLQTRINYNISSSITAHQMLQVNADANGSLQLLGHDATIFEPVPLATAEFRVPNSTDGRWLAKANFYDNNNNSIGELQFAQIWRVPANVIIDPPIAYGKYVFWIGLAIVFGLVFLKSLFSKPTKT